MHRKGLIFLLSNYQALFDEEVAILDRFQKFVKSNPSCFERSLEEGHVTGSSWIVNRDRTKALFTYHKKLDKWLQLGGHCDGQSDVFAVALREAEEESGLTQMISLSSNIFDIDIHLIPGKKPHFHYDVRFAFEARVEDPLIISDESKDLAWKNLSEVDEFSSEPSILRMVRKTKTLV